MGKQKSIIAGLPKKMKSSLIKSKKMKENKKSITRDSILQFKKDNRKTLIVEDTSPFSLNKSEIDQIKNNIFDKDGFSENLSWEEIDFYEIGKPFTFISVIQHVDTRDKRYILIEPPLNNKEKTIYNFIINTLNTVSTNTVEIEKSGATTVLEKLVDEIITDYSLNVSQKEKDKLFYYLKKNLLGLAKLEPLMNDPQIEDISCDGSEVPLFLYHREHGSIQSNIQFTDEEELSGFVIKLAQKCGKHISIANPMIDATMPDGSRIQMTLSTEISTKGSTFTIRKFREEPFSPPDLVRFNTMSSEMIAYLWMAIEHGFNALISGGTASGKTSTLNALALFIPRESKIVSIEETREINLPHPNWIPGVSRSGFGEIIDGKITGEIDMYDLMKAALRQRPEYILVGEIRGREAYVLFQAMATGHTTYSTVHADSTKSLIHRLEGEPINIPRIMLQSLDIVCLQTISRVKNKRARRCKQIIEIIDIDPTTKELLTNEVFHWDPVKDSFQYSGKSYILEQIRAKNNMNHSMITDELTRRAKIIDWMLLKEITNFEEVAISTAQYYENKNELIAKIETD
jgi:flagellar protein FlaI